MLCSVNGCLGLLLLTKCYPVSCYPVFSVFNISMLFEVVGILVEHTDITHRISVGRSCRFWCVSRD